MKKAIITLVILVLLSSLLWAYFFFFRAPETHVTLEFNVPNDIRAGKPFPLSVSYSNFSDRLIQGAKLSLVIPQDMAFAGASRDQRVKDVQIGDIGPGTLGQEEFDLLVLGGTQSVKHVSAKLRYRTSGSSSEFEKEETVDLAVGRSAVVLNVRVPEKIQSGETFDLTIEYENTSEESLEDIRLRMTYPPSFQFQKASEEPSRSNNEWNLETLSRGSKGEIKVTGSVIAPANAFTNFGAVVLGGFGRDEYEIVSQNTELTVGVSPLSVSITANGETNPVAYPGGRVNYSLFYKNNSNTAMDNVSLKASLSGEMFDMTSINSSGFLNSISNTITWNPTTNRELARVEAGGEGRVDFSVQLRGDYPLRRTSDKNFTVKVQAQIESPTNISGGKTLSLAQSEVKLGGRVDLERKVLFRDAASGILNSGPYPPRVNRATQYTVHWIIRNYATDLTNVRVTSALLSGAKFTGQVKSNIEAKPSYNSQNGTLSWDIGNIAATKGVLGEPIEAIFQIEHTPGANQVGDRVPIIADARLVAKDAFTGLELSDSVTGVGTDIPDDVSLGSGGRQVLP